MKHVKRSDCRTQARGLIMEYHHDIIESEVLLNQINQAWDAKEREEAERIKRETDASWKEYEAYKDALDEEDNRNAIAEIEKYFQSLEESGEPEKFHLKDKKRAARRRANVYAKKRLLKKVNKAEKNLEKRAEDDMKNIRYHSSEGFNLRVMRVVTLQKRAMRIKC